MYRNDLINQAIGDRSVRAIAKESGLSFDTISRAREGENLSVKSLKAVADALGLQMVDLFTFRKNGGRKRSADSIALQN